MTSIFSVVFPVTSDVTDGLLGLRPVVVVAVAVGVAGESAGPLALALALALPLALPLALAPGLDVVAGVAVLVVVCARTPEN